MAELACAPSRRVSRETTAVVASPESTKAACVHAAERALTMQPTPTWQR